MNKNELITKVANRLGDTKKNISTIIDTTFEIIGQAVIDGESVGITNFGKFTSKDIPARMYRNPKTGETFEGTATRKVMFKVSSVLKDAVKGE